MERLKEKIEVALKALLTLEEITNKTTPPDEIIRDAAIQRFEYTFETFWKASQNYLLVKEGIKSDSPKSVIRSLHEIDMLSEEECELSLQMVDDRNLTTHTYNESLADDIYTKLSTYAALIHKVLRQIESHTKTPPSPQS